ncbi:hypothetical protein IMSHALPRED_010351 [Imshaugia aleurites]|uniref:Major facilitator superfamily (MFS) profile domain-containing protein n=1 Tax=Imshaugia aleurites TaxID=172621 RepID=A0A8H3G9Y5_9LECA|nr:hypothetical protein IMSHALPRED_010351 [Imshaugia aleurites]
MDSISTHRAQGLFDSANGPLSPTSLHSAVQEASPSSMDATGGNDIEAQKSTAGPVTKTQSAGPPYSIYTHRQKNFIVLMSCLGGLFSPLSSSSILPALPVLASTYATSVPVINLSVTVFMVLQAIAPSLTGDLADMAGRRPAYISSFLFILAANIGLALQSNLVAFYILRCLQSVGSSGTYSLNSGVVADICTTAERGKYMGAAQSGIMLGPALSPVIGGILTEYLGWRAIFWFLFIIAGVYLSVFAVFVPETARKIVGNGSLPPTVWFNRSVLNYLARRREVKSWTLKEIAVKRKEAEELVAKRQLRWPNPFKTLRIVAEKDCACIMFTVAIVYASWYTVTTTLGTSVRSIYGLTTLQAGLCYLPFGAGGALAVYVNGRLLDWNYSRTCRRLGLSVNKRKGADLANFPIEMARLDWVWSQLYIGCGALVAYGWTLRPEAHLAAPLVLTFLIGVFMTTTYNSLNILLVDLYPDSPSTASAASNFTRCLMGAAGSAVIEPMISRMGSGWAFTLVGLIVVVASPMLYVVRRWGPVWREERRIKMANRKEEKEAAGDANARPNEKK